MILKVIIKKKSNKDKGRTLLDEKRVTSDQEKHDARCSYHGQAPI